MNHSTKLILEIILSAALVLIPTAFIFSRLVGIPSFWDAQFLWSAGLAMCWAVVAGGYYHQGWMVRSSQNARNVSWVLPAAVFVVQCILFVKGVYYRDWSLVWGALVVNSGVVFSFYQIARVREK